MCPDGYDMLSELGRICSLELGEAAIDELISLYDSNNTRDAFEFKYRVYQTVRDILDDAGFRPKQETSFSPLVESTIS